MPPCRAEVVELAPKTQKQGETVLKYSLDAVSSAPYSLPPCIVSGQSSVASWQHPPHPLFLLTIPSTSNHKQVSLAPLKEPPAGSHYIENSYIVALKKGISPAAFDAHINFIQNEVQHAQVDDSLQEIVLKHSIHNTHRSKGYAGTFHQALSTRSEQDQRLTLLKLIRSLITML